MPILLIFFLVMNVVSFAALSLAPLLVSGTDAGALVILPA